MTNFDNTRNIGSVHLAPTGDLTYSVEMKASGPHTDFIARITAPNFDAALAEANSRYASTHAALDTRS